MSYVQHKHGAYFTDESPHTHVNTARWNTKIRSGSAQLLDSLFNPRPSQILQPENRQAPDTSEDTEIDLTITDGDLLELLEGPRTDRSLKVSSGSVCSSDTCSAYNPLLQHQDWTEWSNAFSNRRCIVNKRSGAVFTDCSLTDLDSNTSDREDLLSVKSKFTVRSRPSSIRLETRLRCDHQKDLKGASFSKVIKAWRNPVFQVASRPIPSLPAPHARLNSSYFHHDFNVIKPLPYKQSLAQLGIASTSLRNARVIAQVDRKLILATVPLPSSHGTTAKHALVLVDQHAASERIHVEALYTQLCTLASKTNISITSNLGYSSTVTTATLGEPLIFPISPQDTVLIQYAAPYFAQWGVLYDVGTPSTSFHPEVPQMLTTVDESSVCVKVLTLPSTIAARCLDEASLVLDMLRSEALRLSEEVSLGSQLYPVPPAESADGSTERVPAWTVRIPKCPAPILSLIHSRACRSAVMFNDELSTGECEDLLRRLSECVIPRMCAHGRVGIVAVCIVDGALDDDIGVLAGGCGEGRLGFGETKEKKVADAWKEWMARMGN